MVREDFIKWNKTRNNPLPPLTGNQSQFLDFLCNNIEDIDILGDLESIFDKFKNYIRLGYDRKNHEGTTNH